MDGKKGRNRTALYARVSTVNGRQDVDVQLRELRAYAKLRGLRVVGEYVDHTSGAKEKRPGLDRLMRDARWRRIDTVLVWRFDRFGRSLLHLARSLDEFQRLGVDFVSKMENLDTLTPAGKLMFQIIGATAEFERNIIQERVRAGVRKAQAEGTRSGKPIGRPWVKADAAKIRKLLKQDKSYREIANALGVSPMTVCNRLRK